MRRCLWVGVVSGILTAAGYGQAELFEDGLTLDPNDTTFLVPYWVSPNATRTNVELSANNGGLYLYAGKKESAKGRFDGGASIFGNPISLVLSEDNPSNKGSLAVWGSMNHYLNGDSVPPLFSIDANAQVANFDGVDVDIDGTLTVSGSVVMTFDALNASLQASTPPTSTAWKAAYVPRGNVSNGAAFATGAATASGESSVAHGLAQTVASGDYSFAMGSHAIASGYGAFSMGWNSRATEQNAWAQGDVVTASGMYSHARGMYSTASAPLSWVNGEYLRANSYAETVIGRFNKIESSANSYSWMAADAIFRIGNGTDVDTSERSDAVTVRKNGETTLTNKVWKDANLGLEEPTSPGSAGGKALVVDGHTLLNGRVTIAVPQGDISMGIYQ